jgi:RimJ/RimL family protein N-acetyltransferase
MLIPDIHTDRLLLREYRETDFSDIHEYATDPEVVRYVPFGPNTEDETRNFIHRNLDQQQDPDRKIFGFAIVLKSEQKIIGGGSLKIFTEGVTTLGYALNRRYWSKGYATEFARAVLAFGFTQINVHRICSTCDIENRASAHVMEKIGMRREGLWIEDCFIKGEWRSSYTYAILQREWREKNKI